MAWQPFYRLLFTKLTDNDSYVQRHPSPCGASNLKNQELLLPVNIENTKSIHKHIPKVDHNAAQLRCYVQFLLERSRVSLSLHKAVTKSWAEKLIINKKCM